MSVYFLAPLIGVVVGLRAMAAPAVVSWGGISPPNASGSAWLAFLGYAWPPYILSALAIAELISDQLPKTPSRKVPMQYGARVMTGAGAALGASRGAWIGGLVAGAIGARRGRDARRL